MWRSTPGSALPDRRARSLGIVRASGGARVGATILVVVGLCAAVPQLLAPIDPTEQRLLARFTPPLSRSVDGTFAVLGTDQLGRDILSRLIYGARTSSLIGFAAVLIAGLTGTALGLLAGVRGGVSDHAVMRLADMQLAVRERPFVEAARSLGLTLPHLVVRHILPNVSASLMVVATFGIEDATPTEAGLSFLGLGVPVAIPSWGGMLAEGRQYVDTRYWLALFPGAALFLTVMAINLVGDTLRDAFDPYFHFQRTLNPHKSCLSLPATD